MTHRLLLMLSVSWLASCDSPPAVTLDAGCGDCDAAPVVTPDAGLSPDAEEPARVAQKLAPVRDLDILFVVDNSGSMAEEQASLAANFQRFINTLRTIDGGLPNLHVGVVSTDMGAGPYNISGCVQSGDRGRLQSAARGACSPPSGAFISDVSNGAGGRSTNYTGTLEDSFSCIARLGIDGCGFEQPLESMRRALDGSNPENAGFLRPGAALAVIIMSDEDDCSASNEGMYDTAQVAITDPLGPLSSFRCFEFGVRCDGDDPRTEGAKHSCVPRDDSPYLYQISEYADFLRGLKADPDLVMLGMITGNSSPVAVDLNEMSNPQLRPSCLSSAGQAAPAVRLNHLASLFPNRNTQTTICNDDLSDALIGTAANLGAGIGGACLVNNPADLEPGTAGLQTDCRVADVSGFGTANQTDVQNIPECATAASGACFRLIMPSSECTGVEAQIDRRGTARPANTVPGIWCSAE